MSVIASHDVGWIICHNSFTKIVYKKTRTFENTKSYSLDSALFDIQVPFVKNKIQKSDSKERASNDVILVKKAHKCLYELYVSKCLPTFVKANDNNSAKTLASNFYKKLTRHPNLGFHGGNNSIEPLATKVGKDIYLIPEESLFYCYDIIDLSKHIREKLFDFILLDPPWWNKFIRRKRKKNEKLGYNMLSNDDLSKIPIHTFLEENGIVGVWCTNAPSHCNSVTMNLFKAWNIEFVTQWFWLKVTQFGEPICEFSNSLGKQPFERIIFGVKKSSTKKTPTLEKNKVFMSIPSALHSHKPPLCDIIKPFLPEKAKCLELFARYLLPKWTSYGNEVLKLQHLSLYKEE